MATRSIVTSQPDVACDVCERRLLRGEQPDVFLAAGQPRTVCELCAPRAAHQGWQREADQGSLRPAPLRAGRGRNLFERLRQARRPPGPSRVDSEGARIAREPETYDFLGGADPAAAQAMQAALEGVTGGSAAGLQPDEHSGHRDLPVQRAIAEGPLQQAAAIFNIGEYPRRVASLTRSLGVPEVTVRPGEAVASSVVIVVAWELCWYTYEIDLDDMQGPQARAIAQGTELSELRSEDRQANATVDERGALALL
jgi:hypothetical protein